MLFVPKSCVSQQRVLERIYNISSVRGFPNVQEINELLELSEGEVMRTAHLLQGQGLAFVHSDKRPFMVGCTPEGG